MAETELKLWLVSHQKENHSASQPNFKIVAAPNEVSARSVALTGARFATGDVEELSADEARVLFELY
jgi:hypothetical protein